MGTSYIFCFAINANRDHPHACGDKPTFRHKSSYRKGSSPRMWGQGVTDGNSPPVLRIIPTHVGTSNKLCPHCIGYRDHPHECGDKSVVKRRNKKQRGSSPRVWGQDPVYQQASATSRIIPTRVGTRALLRYDSDRAKDHPHACGDKPLSAGLFAVSVGSSPRVWGQGWNFLDKQLRDRIIPTRVGTSAQTAE